MARALATKAAPISGKRATPTPVEKQKLHIKEVRIISLPRRNDTISMRTLRRRRA